MRSLLPFALGMVAALCAAPCFAAITLGQHGSHDNGAVSSTTVAVTLTGVVSGSLLRCDVSVNAGFAATVSVSDTVNGAWSAENAMLTNVPLNQQTGSFFFANSAAGNPVITATFSHTDTFGAMNAQEFKGVATSSPLDKKTAQNGTTANPTSGSVTPVQSNELIVGALEWNAGSPTPGSGFSTIDTAATTQLTSEYQIQGTAAAISATWTLAATGWTAQVATYKAAGGAAAPKAITKKKKLEKLDLSFGAL